MLYLKVHRVLRPYVESSFFIACLHAGIKPAELKRLLQYNVHWPLWLSSDIFVVFRFAVNGADAEFQLEAVLSLERNVFVKNASDYSICFIFSVSSVMRDQCETDVRNGAENMECRSKADCKVALREKDRQTQTTVCRPILVFMFKTLKSKGMKPLLNTHPYTYFS